MTYANQAGTPRRHDTHAWLAGQTIRRRTETRPTTETDEHTPRVATPPAWMDAAKPCDYMEWGAEWDEDLRDRVDGAQVAADLCFGCPVLDMCLETAMKEEGSLTKRNRYLIRGGLTPEARADLAASARKCALPGHENDWTTMTDGCYRCAACHRESQKLRGKAGRVA